MSKAHLDLRSRILEDPAYAIEAERGDLIMDVTEAICGILESEGIERKELAVRIGKTKSYVSQVLNGSRNMTLATVADIALALGYKPVVRFEKNLGKTIFRDSKEVDFAEDECVYETKVA